LFLDKSTNEFREDVLTGLCNGSQKSLPSKYLYDDIGSELFEKITLQPEYYPTRTEIKLLDDYAKNIIDHIQKEIVLIELGSGSSRKTKLLFNEILKKQKTLYYFPIDISFNFLSSVVASLENSLKNVIVKGIPYEYIDGMTHCNNILFESNVEFASISRLIIFLGSSIGNFEIEEARTFLKNIRLNMTNNDFLLIGFDLVKDDILIENAYNDKNGITRQFNLNLLNRINKELGANFIINNFSHKAFYNQKKKRVEMHIVSNKDQKVYLSTLDKEIEFKKSETIHTENSYKYSNSDIGELIKRAGFSIVQEFLDDKYWYELVLLKTA
jgi:L-histidine Nalpha-methyltransferase